MPVVKIWNEFLIYQTSEVQTRASTTEVWVAGAGTED